MGLNSGFYTMQTSYGPIAPVAPTQLSNTSGIYPGILPGATDIWYVNVTGSTQKGQAVSFWSETVEFFLAYDNQTNLEVSGNDSYTFHVYPAGGKHTAPETYLLFIPDPFLGYQVGVDTSATPPYPLMASINLPPNESFITMQPAS